KNIQYSQEDINKYATIGGAPFLDGDYTVFGEVIEGIDVIDKICSANCDANNRPIQDIKMKIRIL
ncbi:MAG TPA: peptidylprolyl isomerase, partial [Saprospiraceae bacterium]|nr:peptidylprolyl isomerase [Saprospiraceae bacterium]